MSQHGTKLESHTGCKAILLSLALLSLTAAAVAVVTYRFSNWDSLKRRSPDIFIARCTKTSNAMELLPNGLVLVTRDGLFDSDIDIVCALKGRTNLGPARLTSLYRPRQSEQYLVFSQYHDGIYQAVERYRIVPLGTGFPTNMLAGKSFDEQIRALLQYRVNMINGEMQQAQEEKARLEEGLKQ